MERQSKQGSFAALRNHKHGMTNKGTATTVATAIATATATAKATATATAGLPPPAKDDNRNTNVGRQSNDNGESNSRFLRCAAE